MKHFFSTAYTAAGNLVRSPKFFYVVVGLLVVQALWIALTARYPQAFDENYHWGLIQLHSQQLLPFFTSQPPDSSVYGAVVRDPSYLFHWLMTFPYKLLTHITDSMTIQVIVLRLLNIVIFVAGLFVYRKLLDELRISTGLRNVVLLFFVLLPVVPLLAGHINYDNFMFLLTGLLFLYVVRLVRVLQSTTAQLPVMLLLKIVLVGATGSIVKFPFAPIFFAVAVVLAVMVFRWRRPVLRQRSGPRPGLLLPVRWKLVLVGGLTLIAVLLCAERYGVNLVQYQAPVPKCHKVLSIDECQKYSPWARDHLFAQIYPDPTAQGIAVYPVVWFHRIVWETMFTVTSYIYEPWGTVTYRSFAPLTVVNYTGWTIVCIGMLLAILAWRRIWSDLALRVLLIVTLFYCFVLFVQNFAMYIHSGEAVAIHGRYLIPVFPVLLAVLAIGFKECLDKYRLARYKTALLLITLVLFLQGGGIIGWIVLSDHSWYWQHISAADQANHLTKNVLNWIIHH